MTFKQTEANRRNAQKSTGPRTEEGKKKSRLNAFKHGLTGQLDIMTGDMREAHDTFIARIVDSLKPADALEEQLAHSIAESYWRMNRVSTIENALLAEGDWSLLDHNQDKEFTDLQRALSAARGFIEHPERFNLLTVYEMRLHRKAAADLKQLRELQAERRAQPVETAATAQPNGFVSSTAEFTTPPRQILLSRDREGASTHAAFASTASPQTAAPVLPVPPDVATASSPDAAAASLPPVPEYLMTDIPSHAVRPESSGPA